MSNFPITPILFNYNYLDKLSNECASLLAIDMSDENKSREFKLTIFNNFNNYLMGSILLLPNDESESYLAELIDAMEKCDENKTIDILNKKSDFLLNIRNEFLDIIKKTNK